MSNICGELLARQFLFAECQHKFCFNEQEGGYDTEDAQLGKQRQLIVKVSSRVYGCLGSRIVPYLLPHRQLGVWFSESSFDVHRREPLASAHAHSGVRGWKPRNHFKAKSRKSSPESLTPSHPPPPPPDSPSGKQGLVPHPV